MSFNENLKEAMFCSNYITKELSIKTGINTDTISSYLKKNGSIPTADKAVKIAKALDISVEFLVNGFESDENHDYHTAKRSSFYHKYAKIIETLDSLPEPIRKSIIKLIEEIKNSYTKE